MAWACTDERDFWADKGKESFWWFAREVFNIEGNPKGGWLTERIHKPLCDWFQSHIDPWMAARQTGKGYKLDLMILIPREFGKTTLITRCGMLWLMARDPELSIYIGSENVEKAVRFLNPLKEIMSAADPYQHFTRYYGNWYDKDRSWSSQFVVHARRTSLATQDPSFGVWGVQTGLTGAHPDVICLDDPVSYEKMEQDAGWLQTVNDHVASLIPVLRGDGLRIFVGTRYHDGDYLGTGIRKHGARTISGMPELLQEFTPRPNGVWHVYFLSSRDLNRKPVYPEQWPEDRLAESERENSLKYYAQQENNPASGEHVPLTRQQVDLCWVEKTDVPKNLRISVHIDTAFKYRERIGREDESVIVVFGHARDGSGDVYYLEGYGSNSWRAEQFNTALTTLLQRLRKTGKWPFALTDEMEMGGKSGTWELTLQSWCHAADLPMPPYMVINRSFKNRKISRLTIAATYWTDGKVKLVKGAPGVDRLIDQMIKIGVSEHDDWADAAADVFYKDVYKPVRQIERTEEEEDPRDVYSLRRLMDERRQQRNTRNELHMI